MRIRTLITATTAALLALGATAQAAGQPKILAVIPDIDPAGPDRLFIVGRHLPGGPQLTVRLGESILAVESRQPDLIVVDLPETTPDGSYRLRVFNNHKNVATVAAIVRDVEGAEGPPGAAGDPGADGAPGADGMDGTSCTVSQGSGSVTVNCTDGTSATVFDGVAGADGLDGADGAPGIPGTPGADGADGLDGSSCSVSQDAGGATINCTDGTQATVSDGADGVQGPVGPQGPAGLVNEVCSLYQLTEFPPPLSLISETPEVSCNDELDNDCDGDIDFADLDCEPPPEMCADGIDNDFDGRTDCADTEDCGLMPECGCAPDALEPNDSGQFAFDLGTLSDTFGGGGGNQEGRVATFCNGDGSFFGYADPPEGPFDGADDSRSYFVQVIRDPSYPGLPACDSYTLAVGNGPEGAQQLVTVTGNLAPNDDTDWYRFFAEDDPEGETELDSFRISADLVDNPDEQYRIRVYRRGTQPGDRECVGIWP